MTHPGAALARRLFALAHPARIEILRKLRSPRHVSAIGAHAVVRGRNGEAEGRPISRPAVTFHLRKLLAYGFVNLVDDSDPDDRQYVVNQAKLFAAAEELRSLARIRPDVIAGEATIALDGVTTGPPESGPRLVIVHGLYEGKPFPLNGPVDGGSASWSIGRDADAHVRLEYDPFVSGVNALVRRDRAGTFFVENDPRSKNGTLHNWQRLDGNDRRRLETGDVVGVGRSLLLFRA